MGVRTRPVPEQELQRIADTTTDLLYVAASLGKMAGELEAVDAERAKRLRTLAGRLLDSTDTISDSVLASTRLTSR